MTNTLYYGDNLAVLREHVATDSVDLIYLDPPFNSNASYNILFKSPAGKGADASIEAFGDTWAWGPTAEEALVEVIQSGNSALVALLNAMEKFIGKNAMMAYLAMMAVRLVELHRVLKPTGSLYLHCDPTASHYLKLVLDAVFGPTNFRSELIWRRSASHNDVGRKYGPIHDSILFYAKTEVHRLNAVLQPHSKGYIVGEFRYMDSRGSYRLNEIMGPEIRTGDSGKPWKGYDPTTKARHWAIPEALKRLLPSNGTGLTTQQQLDLLYELDEIYISPAGRPKYKQRPTEGVGLQDIWAFQPGTEGSVHGSPYAIDYDVKWLSNEHEKLGYPTQKPVGLLARIIAASSNPGDVVLDPFCGCGTAVDAAEKLGRRWIGIDVTHLAVGLIEDRMRRGYPGIAFATVGVPADGASALRLAAEKPHEFQNWFCLRVGGYPLDGGRKGADKGVDGHFYFFADTSKSALPGVISVKAGANIGVAMIRDLRGVMEREKYDLALFLSAYEPTKPMIVEAASAGKFDCAFGRFDRIQIVTPADLFHASGSSAFRLPPLAAINRRAARVETRASHQPGAQGALV